MKAPRLVCPVCKRTYSGRWCESRAPGDNPCWTLRRHGWPDICEGSGCEPEAASGRDPQPPYVVGDGPGDEFTPPDGVRGAAARSVSEDAT